MKALNILFFLSPFLIALIFTIFTMTSIYLAWLTYFIWLAMVVGAYVAANYTSTYIRSKKYSLKHVGEVKNLRIAAFVTSYNEDPKIVEETLLSVKSALRGRGEVFLLDDSTKKEIAEELKNFCEKNGITYVHRENRKGFKAGAINNALKLYGDKYDLVSIFDADQRPRSDYFDHIIPYFSDPKVGFVQIPQRYTETRSKIAHGAKFQQEPFLRVIMKGRNIVSAFSLGSGTTFRIDAVRDVGYFDESAITEDAEISVRMHGRGWKSIYHDEQLIWYGEPPLDAASYIQQQNRWAFGNFKITGKILRSDLSFTAFFDYISGFFYWLKEGILTLFELIAPVVFLLFKQGFIAMNPYAYILAYIPYMIITFLIFAFSIRGTSYGVRGFLAHQANEYLAFFGITMAFISFLLGRKIPFKVTPKGKGMRSFKAIIPHIIIFILLIASVVNGSYWLLTSSLPTERGAIAVNLFWALWHIIFLSLTIYFSLSGLKEENEGKYFEEALQ
ncbi:glycosyltransferase [Fervidicoccus fontis]|uniref:Glycosyltransferase n=1 Tax=Fervidicoccus fontis TaxID=683846 RepID=A0A843ADL5_9CREN|nr:cellulose synthase catalytic subunit [Fervidicoccus fontis]MBE9391217.1 glycosyltransferase [Fervidicoccus fontis]